MLEVGFILPPSNNAKPFRQVPLTSLYLLTVLREKLGNQVNVCEIDLRGIKDGDLRYYIPEKDVYFYTVMSPEWEDIKETQNLIKELYPKAKHIAGGVHVYLYQQECLEVFDAISIGEGEITIVEIVQDIINKKPLQQIYKHMEPINPNDYPYPDRSFLPKSSVIQTNLLVNPHHNLLGSDVLFSRWCPFNCAFCVNITFGKTRFRAPYLMEQEIEYLKKAYDIKAVVIKDDNAIPFQREIAPPYLEAVGRCNVKWRGQSRGNGIPESTVKLAAESGCTDIAIGIESASPKVLQIINKKLDLNGAKDYISLLKKYNIGVRLLLILGLPGEDENIYQQTLDFVNETQPTSLVLALFSPYPGSPIWKDPIKYGMRLLPHEYRIMRNYFGRLDPSEQPQMFYEYLDNTPWGYRLDNETILRYYAELQTIFRNKGLNF